MNILKILMSWFSSLMKWRVIYISTHSCPPEDFDSGYEYVYGRIKELKKHIAQNESQDESTYIRYDWAEESLREIYEELLDLYDSALLYDDYSDVDPEDVEDSDDAEDSDDGDFANDDFDDKG